ncbi:MAG: hypothetical protein GY751_12750, partial [Bacteroidetes bacterium]|nr:hypothetical protein [Bacteroidota bacterium]
MNDLHNIQSSSALPPFQLINTVVVLTRIAARYEINTDTLLAGSGIKTSDLNDPQKLITTVQEESIMRKLINLSSVPWIGLEIGREYNFSGNGKLGLAMMCCETLMDALQLIMSYIHLTGSYHQYFIKIKGKTGQARFKELLDLQDIRRATCEAEIASVHSMVSLGYEGKTIFKELHFAYPKPSYSDKYEEYFGCPVKFDAAEHLIIFDTQYLSNPMMLANPLLRAALEKECEQLAARLQNHTTVTAKIHQNLSANPGEFPTLDQMASLINTSSRTIRRRLKEENTSYKTIQTNIRKSMAVELLLTTNLPIEKVSLRLG